MRSERLKADSTRFKDPQKVTNATKADARPAGAGERQSPLPFLTAAVTSAADWRGDCRRGGNRQGRRPEVISWRRARTDDAQTIQIT